MSLVYYVNSTINPTSKNKEKNMTTNTKSNQEQVQNNDLPGVPMVLGMLFSGLIFMGIFIAGVIHLG